MKNNSAASAATAKPAALEAQKAKQLDDRYAEWLRTQRIPTHSREAWAAEFAPDLLPAKPAQV